MPVRLERIDETGSRVLIDIRDEQKLLAEGEGVHRELRTALGPDYLSAVGMVLDDGATVTQLIAEGRVRAVALWRILPSTYTGKRLDIDDLVTAALDRSRGFGRVMLDWIEKRAVDLDCSVVSLNSRFERTNAHRFYEREGYEKVAFHFRKFVDVSAGRMSDKGPRSDGVS